MSTPDLPIDAPAAFLRRGTILRAVEPATAAPEEAMKGRPRFVFDGPGFPEGEPPRLSDVGEVLSGLDKTLSSAQRCDAGYDYSERGSLVVQLLAPEEELESAERRLAANDGRVSWETLPATSLAAETVSAVLAAEPSEAAAQANALSGGFASQLERFGRSLRDLGIENVSQTLVGGHKDDKDHAADAPVRTVSAEHIRQVVKRLEVTEPLEDEPAELVGVLKVLSSTTPETRTWTIETMESIPLPRVFKGLRPGMKIQGAFTPESYAVARDGSFWEHNVRADVAVHRVQQGNRIRRTGVTLLSIELLK